MSAKTNKRARREASAYGFVFSNTFEKLKPRWIKWLVNPQRPWFVNAIGLFFSNRWHAKTAVLKAKYERRSMIKLTKIARQKIIKGLPL